MDVKYFLGIILYIIHYSFNFLILFFSIYSNNFYIILSILLILFIVLLLWYFTNDCLLIAFENFLLNKKNKYNADYNKYFLLKIFDRNIYIFNHVLYSYHVYFILLIFFLCVIKLIYIYKNKK